MTNRSNENDAGLGFESDDDARREERWDQLQKRLDRAMKRLDRHIAESECWNAVARRGRRLGRLH